MNDGTPATVLEALDRVAPLLAQALGFQGRCRYEIVVDDDGRVVELWPHAERGKLARGDLDQLQLRL